MEAALSGLAIFFMGLPIRLVDAGPVVGMAIAQSTGDDRTYSITIETLRDNFPEAFG